MTEFYKVMLRLIDRSSKKVATSELSVLKYELQRHLWTLSEAAAWFVGRQQEVATVRRYITGLSRNCFVVYGPPGSGALYETKISQSRRRPLLWPSPSTSAFKLKTLC